MGVQLAGVSLSDKINKEKKKKYSYFFA